MSMPFKLIASGLVLTSALAAVAAAQQPRIENGAVTAQAAGSPFAQSFRALVSSQPDVAWIGYAVPVSDGERVMCCFDSGTTFRQRHGLQCVRLLRSVPSRALERDQHGLADPVDDAGGRRQTRGC